MSQGLIFSIGAVVFILGGYGVLLYVLDIWQDWRRREDPQGEDEHLAREEGIFPDRRRRVTRPAGERPAVR